MPIGLDVGASELATVTARAATDLPLIVKLTPVAPDLREIARAVVAAGADAISAIGPLPALAVDRERERALLGTAYGGLSGRVLKPIGLRAVYEVAQVVSVPIIGIGGVADLDDVLDYLAAVPPRWAWPRRPWPTRALPGRLALELAAWCERHRITRRARAGGHGAPPPTGPGQPAPGTLAPLAADRRSRPAHAVVTERETQGTPCASGLACRPLTERHSSHE